MLIWIEYQRREGLIRLHSDTGETLEVPLFEGEPDPDLTPFLVEEFAPDVS